MKISKRIQAVGDLVPKHSRVLDVGCDHALLDIYLIQRDQDIHPIASDIAKGPLEHARENVSSWKMTDQIEIKEGNGLAAITPQTDTVVIAGMGGRTIYGILKNQRNLLAGVKTLILSPNSDVPLVRSIASHLGYHLTKEELVEDHKILYHLLKFEKGRQKYSKREIYFGPLLLQERPKLFEVYFDRELEKKKINQRLLPKKYWRRHYLLRREIKWIEEELKK